MLNVGRIEEGFVLDHIKAGKAMTIYHDLGLDKLDCTVAIIKNAKSEKMGKKDILKVECSVDKMDLAMELFEDHGGLVRIPEHIAEDINLITVGNNIVPTLDEVIIHLFNGLIGTLIELNNVPMREM